MAGTRTTQPTLRELLDAHSEAFFSAFHAPIQGRVQSYSTSPARVDVEPIVLLRVEGVKLERSPILRGVPVVFPGGSTSGYTYPLTPGTDTVSLVPQDADLDAFVADGAVGALPTSERRFSLSDAIAIPNNLRPASNPLPATAFAPDGGVLWGRHYLGGSDATDFVAMAAKVLSELQAIVTGYNTHTHPVTGAATGVPASTLPNPSSVASSLFLVK